MVWHRATILSQRQLSPTVTGLTLKIHPQPTTNISIDNSSSSSSNSSNNFTFLPGQWVDFKPHPSNSSWNHPFEKIGGYSLTSIPHSLPQFELAIQRSRHVVAEWATVRARVDDVVDVRVGGTFTYESKSSSAFEEDNDDFIAASSNTDGEHKHCHPRKEEAVLPTNNRLLFIAGGVGINPLYSMIRQWYLDQTAHAKTKQQTNKNDSPRAVLLYSGGSKESLLFVNELEQLMKEKPDQFRVVFTTTTKGQNENGAANNAGINGENRGTLSGGESSSGTAFTEGRIDSEMIRDAVNWLNHSKNMDEKSKQQQQQKQQRELPQEQSSTKIADAVFVCGPPGMPESMMDILSEEKLVQSTDNVHFEKWW